ncbi:uncharacterized protein METZ01_LOCUS225715 [marine metagenome]|uniref:Uncharacterized protein n=1 Tax=marine metagenome TaxID=408172 RepID=A0A382GF95_9ZZZZ
MSYEFEDYRKRKEEPNIGSWPFWILPPQDASGYIFRMMLLLFAIPLVFLGYLFTPATTFIWWVIFDLVEYIKIKRGRGFLP